MEAFEQLLRRYEQAHACPWCGAAEQPGLVHVPCRICGLTSLDAAERHHQWMKRRERRIATQIEKEASS